MRLTSEKFPRYILYDLLNFNRSHQLHDREVNLCVLFQNACDKLAIDLGIQHEHVLINEIEPFY